MNKLKEIRQARGFVLQKIAVASGVSTSTLNAIEKYNYTPRLDTQERLANALGVEVSRIWPSTQTEARQ